MSAPSYSNSLAPLVYFIVCFSNPPGVRGFLRELIVAFLLPFLCSGGKTSKERQEKKCCHPYQRYRTRKIVLPATVRIDRLFARTLS